MFHLPPSTKEATLRLLPERAAYWEAEQTLLIADVHLGKDATFRAEAVPLPLGSTASDLDRLSSLVTRTGAERLIVLGDLYHAPASMTPAPLNALRAWREEHAKLDVVLIRGNHDHDAGASPAGLRIQEHDGPMTLGPFCLQHDPDTETSPDRAGYVLCGHLHPGMVLRSGGQRERLPCFHANGDRLVLPAFSEFTGLHILRPEPGDQVAVVAGDDVVRISPELAGR